MRIETFASLIVTLGLTLTAHAAPSPASALVPAPVQVRIASVAPPDTPWMNDIQAYAADLNVAAHGLIKAKVVMSLAGSSESELVKTALEGNTVQIIGCSSSALVGAVPALEVLEIPFLFEDGAEADYVLDNYVTEAVRTLLREKGFEFYTWAENGWLNIGSKERAVRSPKDLVGMHARTPETIIHLLTWRTFGAIPVTTTLAEGGAALQAGKANAFAQTTLMTLAQSWYKDIKHFTVLHHIYQPLIVAYNKRFFDAQTDEIKALLRERAPKYAASNRTAVRGIEEPLLSQFAGQGVEVVRLTEKERAAFREATHRVKDKFINTAPPEAIALLKVVMQGKAAYAKARGAAAQ